MNRKLIEQLISEIQLSYFANKSPEAADRVIETVKSLQDMGYQEALKVLNEAMRETAKQSVSLDGWNLYAMAARRIRAKIEYSFSKNQTVLFNNRKRMIKSVNKAAKSVELENGEIVPMETLKHVESEHFDEQMSLF